MMLPMLGGSSESNSGGFDSAQAPDPLRDLTPNARESFKKHENSPTAVSDLITEMIEKENMDSSFYRGQLNLLGCSDSEMLRQIASRLKETKDAKRFERIVVVIDGLSFDIRQLPEMKTDIPRGLAAAGRHITGTQLGQMHQSVPALILKTAQFPESADLLAKLASIDDQWNLQILQKMDNFDSEDAAKVAVKIVKDNNGDPSKLSQMIEFKAVSDYFWQGKLTGKKEFQDLWMGRDEVSQKSFAQVVSSMIDEDPESVLAPVMSLFENQYIKRDSIPENSIRKIDGVISAQAEKYLSDIVEGESPEMAEQREKREGPGAYSYLFLAKLLGGRKTALELARLVEENSAIREKFKPIGDALLAINEPETYDVIAELWAVHRYSNNSQLDALRERVGPAIEPNFLELLTSEIAKTKKDTRRLSGLIKAIEEIGTAKSLPILNKMNNIRGGRVSSRARDASYKIKKREKANN